MDSLSKFGLSKEIETAISKAIDEAVEIGRKAGYTQGFADGEKSAYNKTNNAIDQYLEITKIYS